MFVFYRQLSTPYSPSLPSPSLPSPLSHPTPSKFPSPPLPSPSTPCFLPHPTPAKKKEMFAPNEATATFDPPSTKKDPTYPPSIYLIHIPPTPPPPTLFPAKHPPLSPSPFIIPRTHSPPSPLMFFVFFSCSAPLFFYHMVQQTPSFPHPPPPLPFPTANSFSSWRRVFTAPPPMNCRGLFARPHPSYPLATPPHPPITPRIVPLPHTHTHCTPPTQPSLSFSSSSLNPLST